MRRVVQKSCSASFFRRTSSLILVRLPSRLSGSIALPASQPTISTPDSWSPLCLVVWLARSKRERGSGTPLLKIDVWGCRVPRIRRRADSKTDFTEQRVWNLIEALGGYPEQRSPRYWSGSSDGKFEDRPQHADLWRDCPTISEFKNSSAVSIRAERSSNACATVSQTSKLPRQVDSIRAESSSNLYPTAFQTPGTLGSLISSELSSHQMAIRSHLGGSRIQLILLHFGIFGPTG